MWNLYNYGWNGKIRLDGYVYREPCLKISNNKLKVTMIIHTADTQFLLTSNKKLTITLHTEQI